MSLTELSLKFEYRSDSSNIVEEFYVPCMQNSVDYRRAVGYFTSSGLSVAAKGLAEFVHGGGKMRLVASPVLSKEDISAISSGYLAREDVAERAILNQLSDEFLDKMSETTRLRLGCLSWLIADGLLEIRIAIPKLESLTSEEGIYHEKIGIFADSDGNEVAFTGSPNETAGGLVNNFESIDVYMSWDDPHNRVERKTENFERLWTNQTNKLDILSFPEAARKRLLQIRPRVRPTRDLESTHNGRESDIQLIQEDLKVPEFGVPEDLILYPHQTEAVNSWMSLAGDGELQVHKGFLEMATGSGKTIAALTIAVQLYKSLNRLSIVVVAPTRPLIDQWGEEAERFGLLPIKASSDNPNWRTQSWSAARAFRRHHTDHVCILVTNATFATEAFQSLISEFSDPLLLIADEAHNLGASRTLEFLPGNVKYRLALSATPKRHFDEIGTERLSEYFGDTIYKFELKDAIGVCLTPYDYFVTPVPLTSEEMANYQRLSQRIAQLYSIRNRDDSNSAERLLMERAKIISTAQGKVETLSWLVDKLELNSLKHTFVYASDKDPEQTTKVVDVLQRQKRLLVHQFTDKETSDPVLRRELIRRFEAGDDLQVLVAKRCLDEGIDIPPTKLGYFLASTTNPRQYIQRRGRLLRKSPGKTHAVIHDLLVVPPTSGSIQNDTERALLESEFRRIVEFASTARNGANARVSVLDIAKQWGITEAIAMEEL